MRELGKGKATAVTPYSYCLVHPCSQLHPWIAHIRTSLPRLIKPPLSCHQSILALPGGNCFSPSSQAEVPPDCKKPDTVMLRAQCRQLLWELKPFKERGLSFIETKKIIGLVTTVKREGSTTSTKRECSCKQIL